MIDREREREREREIAGYMNRHLVRRAAPIVPA
jgi:hypothetical protein